MSEHTPGPWFSAGPFGPVEEIGDFSVDSQRGDHIAQIPRGIEMSFAERQANAHLIAAAPDLLQACKAAYLLFSEDESRNASKTIAHLPRILADAIKKAEGKP
jgi:hypothetical protein